MSEKAGQVSLLGGNWTSTLVDGSHFLAVLGFLQQGPMKLPLKCSPWRRSYRSPRKARCSRSRSRAQLPPCPSELPMQRPDGRVSPHGQPLWARGGGRTGPIPEVG